MPKQTDEIKRKTIDTSKYEAANGVKPMGYGLWSFEASDGQRVTINQHYLNAEKLALKWAWNWDFSSMTLLPEVDPEAREV